MRKAMAAGAMILATVGLVFWIGSWGAHRHPVRIGSKIFTESVLLAEGGAQLVRANGVECVHGAPLGGTRILWNALLANQIDAYPEYTGTIVQEILTGQAVRSEDDLRRLLRERGVGMTAPLGFNDTYAIGMREVDAARLGIETLSDLRQHPELRLGFSNEFLDRKDGWPALRERYELPQTQVKGLDHDLAYRALAGGTIAATDLYSTDAEIAYYKLRVLRDDLNVFPEYKAVFLYRTDLERRSPAAVAALRKLEGRIDERQMIAMNSRAKLKKVPETEVAAEFLSETMGVHSRGSGSGEIYRLSRWTMQHLELVGISLSAAIVIAIPLGVFASWDAGLGQVILTVVAAIYTVPSLALLVFMIPLLGIGAKPAIVALFLYSLLPIVRNTHAGLVGISPGLRESAEALGLPRFARLWRVELPLASASILAGIQTSAVINVGTATLGGLIGAGGFGEPIMNGIRLDNNHLILLGAVPAALMALAAQGLFGLLGRLVIPEGLRLKRAKE